MQAIFLFVILVSFVHCQLGQPDALPSSNPLKDGILSFQFSSVTGTVWDSITLETVCFDEKDVQISLDICSGKSILSKAELRKNDAIQIPIRNGEYSARIIFKGRQYFSKKTVIHVVRFSSIRNGKGCDMGLDKVTPGFIESIYFDYSDCPSLKIFSGKKTSLHLIVMEGQESYFWSNLFFAIFSYGFGGTQSSLQHSKLEIQLPASGS